MESFLFHFLDLVKEQREKKLLDQEYALEQHNTPFQTVAEESRELHFTSVCHSRCRSDTRKTNPYHDISLLYHHILQSSSPFLFLNYSSTIQPLLCIGCLLSEFKAVVFHLTRRGRESGLLHVGLLGALLGWLWCLWTVHVSSNIRDIVE